MLLAITSTIDSKENAHIIMCSFLKYFLVSTQYTGVLKEECMDIKKKVKILAMQMKNRKKRKRTQISHQDKVGS